MITFGGSIPLLELPADPEGFLQELKNPDPVNKMKIKSITV